jgi:hypothetical protein
MAHPTHPHSRFPVSALVAAAASPVRYAKVPPLDKLIPKLGDGAKDLIIVAMKQFIIGLNQSQKQGGSPLKYLIL